jgi:hypothetical protein
LAALGRTGQAPELLVRGFSGYGEALAVYVDGVPLNHTSHAFRHGYADLNFVIPATVDQVALHLGAYAARFGPGSVAGTLELSTRNLSPGTSLVRIGTGSELGDVRQRLRRLRYQLTGMASPDVKVGRAMLAAEVGIDDGPDVHPQRYRRGAVFGKYSVPLGAGELTTTLQTYAGRWFDSGLLARASVRNGRLTPFSASDPSGGGIATRTAVSLQYRIADRQRATWHLAGYLVDSDLRLYSNPTLFLRDTDAGDGTEYVDQRIYYGIDAYYFRPHRFGGVRVGVQTRIDRIGATTWHVERRLRLIDCYGRQNPCTDTAPSVRSMGSYAEASLRFGAVSVDAGIRLDQENWNVDDRDSDTMLGKTTLGGTGSLARISPKLRASYRLGAIELIGLGGTGARWTDARASSDRSGYGVFAHTYQAEFGARITPTPYVAAAAAVFGSRANSHHAWLADLGVGQRVDSTSRYGAEATLTASLAPWLHVDAGMAVARGRVIAGTAGDGSGLWIAGAPRLIGSGGLALTAVPRSPAEPAASMVSMRVRGMGPRATTVANLPSEGSVIVDVVARHRWRWLELGLTFENLLDRRWAELQFAGQVRTGRTAEPQDDILVSYGAPRSVFVTATVTP